jgi:hypothetical protein
LLAVDAASNIIGNISKNFKTLSGDIKQLIASGQKMQAFGKGIGEVGKYSAPPRARSAPWSASIKRPSPAWTWARA